MTPFGRRMNELRRQRGKTGGGGVCQGGGVWENGQAHANVSSPS